MKPPREAMLIRSGAAFSALIGQKNELGLLHKQQPQNNKKRKHMVGKRTREKKRIREMI